MTEFLELAETLDKIADVSSRNAKIDFVAALLRKVGSEEVRSAALFLGGRIFSENDDKVLNVSWGGLRSALKQVIDFSLDDLSESYQGDTGEAIASLLESEKFAKQTSLFSSPLSIQSLEKSFNEITELQGSGSKKKREAILSHILRDAAPIEAKYIAALVLNDMRIGLSEGLLADGIARAFDVEAKIVRRAWSLCGDLGLVAEQASHGGSSTLEEFKAEVFRPVKPMLATPSETIAELFELGGSFAFEVKLDGARVQIHKEADKVAIYSRRLQDVTESLPDIVEVVQREVLAENAILDGEVVAVDKKGQPYPFQVVMKRFGRTREIDKTSSEVQLHLYLFDLLYQENKQLIDSSYDVRRKALESIVSKENVVESIHTSSAEEATEFFESSKKHGHEGIVAKRVDSLYVPGTRGKNWYKIKHALDTMDLVIIAAEWGHGRRKKWLSDYHLAVRNPETNSYVMIGKTYKGLTDAEFKEMTAKLESISTGKKGHVVSVKPEIVVEVLAAEIQESPTYKSGMALRFARIVNIRKDKSPSDAMTLEELKKVFAAQFEYKASQM
ncbi:MAG: ATP-dependent DNA ligase [Candidatus Thorarchaeota archaeon]|jgi:DNA ligase-1